jgi:flagella basal body P-ring formation protein FlgA
MLPVVASLTATVQDACETAGYQVAEVAVEGLGIDTERLVESDGIEWRWSGAACRTRPTLRLTAWGAQGVLASYTVRPRIAIRVWAPVAAEDVAEGERIPLGTDLVELPQPPFVDPQGAYVARRNLPAGTAISRLQAEREPDARAGTEVTLVASHGPLTITATGELLRDGAFGQRVRVLNQASGTPVTGVLDGPDASGRPTVRIR